MVIISFSKVAFRLKLQVIFVTFWKLSGLRGPDINLLTSVNEKKKANEERYHLIASGYLLHKDYKMKLLF